MQGGPGAALLQMDDVIHIRHWVSAGRRATRRTVNLKCASPSGRRPIDPDAWHPGFRRIRSTRAIFRSAGESVLGSADISEVSLTSTTAPGVTHRWTNLGAFSDEIANARIWAGFHYRFSTRVGTDMGHQIGEYVVKSVMQRQPITGSR